MKKSTRIISFSVLPLAALIALLTIPEAAMAAPWDNVGQKILDIFTGGLSRTIAIIALIACGISAMMGRLSWDWAVKIIVGLVLVFGGAPIIDYFISAVGS